MTIELYRLKTENFFTNTVLAISADQVTVSNCDISKSNKAFRGKSDYEYFLIIDKEHLSKKLEITRTEDLVEFFQSFKKDLQLFQAIRKELDKKEVSYKFSVW